MNVIYHTSTELMRLTEIPKRTFYRWVDDGLIPAVKIVEGRGPGRSDLYDNPVGVWIMLLDELLKRGVRLSGAERAEVRIYRQERWHTGPTHDLEKDYELPTILSNSGRIASYIRQAKIDDVALSALVYSGKVGFVNKPSRERFTEVFLLPAYIAISRLQQYSDPEQMVGIYLGGTRTHHLVKSMAIVSIERLWRWLHDAIRTEFRKQRK